MTAYASTSLAGGAPIPRRRPLLFKPKFLMNQPDLNRLQHFENKILDLVKQHEKKQSCATVGPLIHQLEEIISRYQRGSEEAYSSAMEFRDRMVVDLRALNLIVSSCLNCETHKEKDGNLRTLARLLGSAIEHLRQANFKELWSSRFAFDRDPFTCDFPVRELKARIHQLEQEVAEAKKVNRMDEPVETFVQKCSSCGQDHQTKFFKLPLPEHLSGPPYTYIGTCPNSQKEILMRDLGD